MERRGEHFTGGVARSQGRSLPYGMKLRIRLRASTSPLRGYAQHERHFSARPERTLSGALAESKGKSKDERNTNFAPLLRRIAGD